MADLLGEAWLGMGAQSRIDPESLSNSDKKRNRHDHARKTREQRLAEALETEEGRAAYAANLAHAEDLFKKVLAMDSTLTVAYRGLGMVYEQQNRTSEAVQAYLTYARSATDAPDRSIVVSRIKALTAKLKESSSDRS
jgi:cytochrome c-type biogenesis protein CcmH/NrfG